MRTTLLTLCFLLVSFYSVEAQNKLGYIDSNELLVLMPESQSMQTELQNYANGLESQLAAMQAEGEAKLTEFQQQEATMSDLVKQDKVRELESIQQRILEFQQNAQQALGNKEKELLTPIIEKARKAIEDVAEEGKYTYIFDASMGSLLYKDESENILPLVKAKLGL
tara:strand:- start:7 stop:507 length:501 start_codon:yes stop_codon:yes gene_type:complete